jgi:hypothetical protein
MSTGESRSKPSSIATRPTERWAVFGLPPLLGSEKHTDYEELFAKISEAVKPADILEEIWICDIADLTWEVWRLRRLKANLIDASAVKPFDHGPGERVVSGDAQTLSQDLDQIEQIERMTAMAEARRNNALHEIERHRATFANALRRNVQQIEEGECQVVDAESVEESDGA